MPRRTCLGALAAALVAASPAAADCPPVAPAGQARAPAARTVTVTFFGVSTLVFDDGERQLLVDGYFSRPGFLRTAFLPVGPHGGEIEQALQAAGVRRLAAVLTAHNHHDHALDTAYIARKHSEATVVGDRDVGALALSRGVRSAQVCVPRPGEAYDFGPYRVTAHLTPHGRTHPALDRLLDRDLVRAFPGPAWFGRYRDAQNLSFLVDYGGRRVLVHPSAGLPAYGRVDAEVAFLGAGGLARQEPDAPRTYWDAAVPPTARLVVPIHWDSFMRPLKRGLKPTPAFLDDSARTLAAFDGLAARDRADGRDIQVRRLGAYGRVVLAPGKPASASDAPPS